MPNNIKLERKKLYKEVWAVPMSRLAPKYGLSGNGLKKICKKLNIPVPPRGYWARLQHGYKVKKTPLPKLKTGAIDSHTILQADSKIRESNKLESFSADAVDLINLISEKPAVKVLPQLESPHRLTLKTQKSLQKAKVEENLVVTPTRKGCLNICVAPGNLDRALRTMDALVKGLEERGFRLLNDKEKYFGHHVKILGEKIYFSLEEKTKQVDHVLTKQEIEDQKKYSWSYAPKFDYIPTGVLILKIQENDTVPGIQKRWADGKTRLIEDVLDNFIIGLIKVADGKIRERREREERRLRWEEEWRQREEAAERWRLEQQRRQDLEDQALLWNKSQLVRNFISAVEERYIESHADKEIQGQIKQWLIWARQHANRLDPLKNGLLFEKNKPDDF